MKIILAKHSGACYGVKRALDYAKEVSKAIQGKNPPEKAYTLGPIIHNPEVVYKLEQEGIMPVHNASLVDHGKVIIRSHGVPPIVNEELARKQVEVVDATCPHVKRAQRAAASLARGGYHVIVVGTKNHPEVEGIVAYAKKEGEAVDVVGTPQDLPLDISGKVGIVVQTTQSKKVLKSVVDAVRSKGCDPKVENTICSATVLRQSEAVKLAAEVDVMLIVGGKNSSNTNRLFEICLSACDHTYHIERISEISPEWFEDASSVGISAGASTPADQIDAVLSYLKRLSQEMNH